MATTDAAVLSLSRFLTEAAFGESKFIFRYSGIVCVKEENKSKQFNL